MLMDVVLGFSLGKITRCALLQSRISAESFFSQYWRSSCSEALGRRLLRGCMVRPLNSVASNWIGDFETGEFGKIIVR